MDLSGNEIHRNEIHPARLMKTLLRAPRLPQRECVAGHTRVQTLVLNKLFVCSEGKKQPSPQVKKKLYIFLSITQSISPPQSTAPDFKRGHKSAQVSSFIPLPLSNYTDRIYDLNLAWVNVFGAFTGPTSLTPSVTIIAEAQQSASQQKLETF